ncbi:MAG: hypothetical protein JKY31_10570 [Rhodobacteraceae bacterium]|nr:hypothetical protein [Paracoccaceae bacterium]
MNKVEFHGNIESIGNARKTTIVMLSGGVDSVYVLAKLLKETDDIILAHHIHLLNKDGRHKVEGERCRKIIDCCRKKYRHLEYSESAIDHRGLFGESVDIVAAAFQAGIVGRSYAAKYERPANRWIFGLSEEKVYDANSHTHLRKACAASCYPFPAPELYRMPIISMVDQIRYLPVELANLCWTCRNPIWRENGEFDECNVCANCSIMARTSNTLSEIPSTRPIILTGLENVF